MVSKTWLTLADNNTINNVELQESQTISHLKVFKSLIALRQNSTMKYGGLQMKVINNDGARVQTTNEKTE